LRSLGERLRHDEQATILPLFAVLLLVLLGFAAIGVDASAAFAEKRQSQSAADAAVLAAALEYLAPTSPSGLDIAAQVKSYAATNAPGTPSSDADWASCLDPDKPADYSPVLDTSITPAVAISDCISLKQVNGEPALLRVRLPNWDMPTSFAGLIGFDTVAISATATAELRYAELSNVLPFSLPSDYGTEQCLATSPAGLLADGPPGSNSCGKSSNGNFGFIDSPWFGAGKPHFTIPQGCGTTPYPNFKTRTPHNLAIGLDHLITTFPGGSPGDGISFNVTDPGVDTCSASAGTVPYILATQPGDTQTGRELLQEGLLGVDPSPTAASAPGRLRQAPLPKYSDSPMGFRTNVANYDVDNVGLWKYLIATDNNGTECDLGSFGGAGRELTDQMFNCLDQTRTWETMFDSDLLVSPRFALVPVLNYKVGDLTGKGYWAVKELRPVYLQMTWYNCTKGSEKECLFQPDDLTPDPLDRETYSIFFNPGEGSESPCYLNAGNACVRPNDSNFRVMGVSVFVLDWDMFAPGAKNQFGGNAPFEVFLFNNE